VQVHVTPLEMTLPSGSPRFFEPVYIFNQEINPPQKTMTKNLVPKDLLSLSLLVVEIT